MKFGVRLAVQGEMGAPGAGFDSVWLPDHVINARMQKRTPMLENWTALSALADQRVSGAGRGLGHVKRLHRRRLAVIRNLDGSHRQITSRPAYLNSTPGSHSATAGTNNTINSPITWMTMNCIMPR